MNTSLLLPGTSTMTKTRTNTVEVRVTEKGEVNEREGKTVIQRGGGEGGETRVSETGTATVRDMEIEKETWKEEKPVTTLPFIHTHSLSVSRSLPLFSISGSPSPSQSFPLCVRSFCVCSGCLSSFVSVFSQSVLLRFSPPSSGGAHRRLAACGT